MRTYYNKRYHQKVHYNLLNDPMYYEFRADYSDKIYWGIFASRMKNMNTKNFLEFGCGIGQNLYHHRNNTIGIDISDYCISQCKKRGILAFKSIHGVRKSSIDGAMCIHCLEHVDSPKDTLKHIHSILKKKGLFLLVLPVEEKGIPTKKVFERDTSKHLYAWNFLTADNLLMDCGFEILLNKINYAAGFSKVYMFSRDIALVYLKILGRIFNRKEMIILARKK